MRCTRHAVRNDSPGVWLTATPDVQAKLAVATTAPDGSKSVAPCTCPRVHLDALGQFAVPIVELHGAGRHDLPVGEMELTLH